MTINDSRPPKPKRRWYHFSLQTLSKGKSLREGNAIKRYALSMLPVGMVLVVGTLGCGPGREPSVASRRTEADQPKPTSQDEAIAEIEKLGGTVEVDENSPGKPVITVPVPPAESSAAAGIVRYQFDFSHQIVQNPLRMFRNEPIWIDFRIANSRTFCGTTEDRWFV